MDQTDLGFGKRLVDSDDHEPSRLESIKHALQDFLLQGHVEVGKNEVSTQDEVERSSRHRLSNILRLEFDVNLVFDVNDLAEPRLTEEAAPRMGMPTWLGTRTRDGVATVFRSHDERQEEPTVGGEENPNDNSRVKESESPCLVSS